MPFSRKELLLLALITLVAACLRLYRLEEIPPGLCGDTAYKGVAADRILDGECPIFFEESWGGIEPMYMYLLAGFFKAFGSTPLAIKALSAVIGTLTIPATYLLIRALLDSPTIALLAGNWLAVSYWHISYSRIGWEIILAPLFVVLTLLFLWRGLRTNRWRDFALAGLFLGAGLYTYQAVRFLPILVIVYVAYRTVVEPGFWRNYGPRVVLCFLVALLVFAPLGVYFATHSDTFLRRAGEVSIFNPDKNPQGPLYSLALSSLKVLGTYNLRGDPYWRHNLPGRPAFDILTSAFFFLGLAVSVSRWRERNYSLLLLWLLVLTLPPILTPPRDVPHFSRSIGALPAACVFPALGVRTAWSWLRARSPSTRTRTLAAACVVALIAASAVLSFRDYFIVWAGNADLRDHYFDGQFVDLANTMNKLDDPNGVWILPISALAVPHAEAGHHTVEFLYRGQAPFHFLRLDESTVAGELSEMVREHSRALLVDYKNYILEEAYNYIDADPKQLAPFLLGKRGRQLEHHEFDAFDVRVYAMPAGGDISIADTLTPLSADFAGQLMLTGAAYGVRAHDQPAEMELPSGGEAWVVLRWRSPAPPKADYKVALLLLDQRDRIAGQVDKLLLSNHTRLTSYWQPGQEEMDYYVLPSLPATAPGDYHIDVVVYDPLTMERLGLLDAGGNSLGYSYTIGRLIVIRAVSPGVVEPNHRIEADPLVPELTLLGFDLPRVEVNPGDAVEVALYWKALQDVSSDYVVVTRLRNRGGTTWGHDEGRPAYGDYSTSQWEEGEIVRDWREILVGVETPSGDYTIHVGLATEGESVAELALGTVHVSGRARSFEIPAMDHEVGWLLGDGVRLLGYDMEGTVGPGEPVILTLYWQCLTEMTESYTVFTHLLDGDSVIRGQVDGLPAAGEAPTTSWTAGEVITDQFLIPVDSEAPEGEYLVEIGMYHASTMERLPVRDAEGTYQGDRILLGPVQVGR